MNQMIDDVEDEEPFSDQDEPEFNDEGNEGNANEVNLKRGPWTAAEDAMLLKYVEINGVGDWNQVHKKSDLLRCGKSCRLRWTNHLRPNLKKEPFTPDEEHTIMKLHIEWGNKWARIAKCVSIL